MDLSESFTQKLSWDIVSLINTKIHEKGGRATKYLQTLYESTQEYIGKGVDPQNTSNMSEAFTRFMVKIYRFEKKKRGEIPCKSHITK